MNFITLMILSPLLGSCILLFAPRDSRRLIKAVSGIFLGISFVSALVMLFLFDKNLPGMQFADEYLWISRLGIKYWVGVDGISVLFVVLSAFTAFIAYLLPFGNEQRAKEFYILLLVEYAAVTGCFAALDAVLFVIFLQMSILPMFIMIGIWGGAHKILASRRYVIHSLISSVIILGSILFCHKYSAGDGFNIVNVFAVASSMPAGAKVVLFFCLFAAFGALSGVFPFHGWVSQASYEAPTQVSILLSGVWLKIGLYAMIRFLYQINPFDAGLAKYIFAVAGLLTVFYGAFYCAAISEVRKLVAYSAVFFSGFFLLGLGSFDVVGVTGVIFNMISHGVLMVFLFVISDKIKLLTGTGTIAELGSLSSKSPLLSFFAAAAVLGAISFPGTGTFVGSFLTVLGAFKSFPLMAVLLLAAYFVYAGVFLKFLQEVFYVDKNRSGQNVKDLGTGDVLTLCPVFILLVFAGTAPKYIINIAAKAVAVLFN